MNKIKSFLPALIYTFLLFAIVVISALLAEESPIAYSAQENTQNISWEEKYEYNDSVPRSAYPDGTQKIYGEGNIILHNVHFLPMGNIVIASSLCPRGDIVSEEKVLSVILLSDTNEILKIYSVPLTDGTFLTSQTTSIGIVIAVESGISSSVFIIPYTLDTYSEYHLKLSNEAKIFPSEDSFFVFSTYKQQAILYSFNNNSFRFISFSRGEIIDIFEKNDTFSLFISNQNGWNKIEIDKKTLQELSSEKMSNYPLQYIFPIFKNGQVFYYAIENENRISIYQDKLIATKNLGEISIQSAFATSDSVYIMCRNDFCSLLQISLDLVTSITNIEQNFDSVGNITYEYGIVSFLASGEEYLYYIEITDMFVECNKIDTASDAYFLLTILNGPAIVFSQQIDTFDYIKIAHVF